MTHALIEVDPTTDAQWCALATAHGSLFESPPWLASIRDGFGVEMKAVLDTEAGAGFVVGYVDDEIGPRLVTLPFSDYCGPLGVSDMAGWRRLGGPYLESQLPFRIRSRSVGFLTEDERLLESGRYAWHGVELLAAEDEQWSSLTSGARQNIRRARRELVAMSASTGREPLRRFESLHRELRRTKYRMLSQPPEYFDALHENFGDDLVVLEATVDGDVVAAVVLLRWGTTAYYKFNASSPAASSLRANDLLMWEAIRHAATAWRCSDLDLGLSDLDQPGLLRYKAKYATKTDDITAWSTTKRGDEARASIVRERANDLVERATGDGATTEALIQASRELYRLFC